MTRSSLREPQPMFEDRKGPSRAFYSRPDAWNVQTMLITAQLRGGARQGRRGNCESDSLRMAMMLAYCSRGSYSGCSPRRTYPKPRHLHVFAAVRVAARVAARATVRRLLRFTRSRVVSMRRSVGSSSARYRLWTMPGSRRSVKIFAVRLRR